MCIAVKNQPGQDPELLTHLKVLRVRFTLDPPTLDKGFFHIERLPKLWSFWVLSIIQHLVFGGPKRGP